ncbi:hypothetical protein HRG84_10995 [Flavisolibacter sp. BT320]|nr:hypothetical protein [Flavisolibacter longurius]
MGRFVFFWVLLVAFTAQTFQQAGSVLAFEISPGWYAKNCENKTRPQLKCGGKCQLMKKLQEEESNNRQHPQHKLENNQQVLYSVEQFAVLPSLTIEANSDDYPSLPPVYPVDRSYPVFHPPTFV